MITVISGLPGAGKTLRAVWLAKQLAADGSQVYELGINGCEHDQLGIKPFPGELKDWAQLLAPKDTLIVDEVQRFLPNRPASQRPAAWIEEFSRNRHLGVELIFITQDPMNIDAFVRRLVNKHEHLVNVFGGEKARVYRFESVQDVSAKGLKIARKYADETTWPYPKEMYSAYKSAELHTRKKFVPRKLKMLYASLAVCALAIIASVGILWRVKANAAPKPAAPVVAAAPVKSPSPARADRDVKHKTTAEWLAQFDPRVRGITWSEPAFDDRKVSTNPEVYCMAGEQLCICHTEQGTRIQMEDKSCRNIALNGMYNPFRRVVEHREVNEVQRQYDEDRQQQRRRDQQLQAGLDGDGRPYIPGSRSSGLNSFDHSHAAQADPTPAKPQAQSETVRLPTVPIR